MNTERNMSKNIFLGTTIGVVGPEPDKMVEESAAQIPLTVLTEPHEFIDLKRTPPAAATRKSTQRVVTQNTRQKRQSKQACKAFDSGGPTLRENVGIPDTKTLLGLGLKDNSFKKFYPQTTVSHPSDECIEEGKVVQVRSGKGTKAVEGFLQKYKCFKKTTGVVTEELTPHRNDYSEGTHYAVQEVLGVGSFGKVDLCVDSYTRKQFVKKQVEKFYPSEVAVPSTHSHKNITGFYGVIRRFLPNRQPVVELLIEYAGLALNKFVMREYKLTGDDIWSVVKQGFEGLAYLHRFSIIHQDIKPENMCVLEQKNGSLVLKLTDFGSCKLPQEQFTFVGLTPEYLAPELAKMVLMRLFGKDPSMYDDVTGKVDVFAFGLVIMYLYKKYHILQALCTGGANNYNAYSDMGRQLLHQRLLIALATQKDMLQNLVPDECDLDMRELLKKLVKSDPSERFSAKDALLQIEAVNKRKQMELVAEENQVWALSPTVPNFSEKVPDTWPDIIDVDMPDSPFSDIPGIAASAMETENGQIKTGTMDKFRKKLRSEPYGKGKVVKGKGKIQHRAPSGVASGRGLASKRMPDWPMSPAEEVRGALRVRVVGVTESNAPVAQPSMDPTTNCMTPQIPQPYIGTQRGRAVGKLDVWQQRAETAVENASYDVNLRGHVDQPMLVQQCAPQTPQTPQLQNFSPEQKQLYMMMLQGLLKQNLNNSVLPQPMTVAVNNASYASPRVIPAQAERMDDSEVCDAGAGNIPDFGALN